MPTKKRAHQVDVYATIRIYINAIENAAINAYMGDIDRKDSLMNYLDGALQAIKGLAQSSPGNDDCPWPLTPMGCQPPNL
ncbi:MAG: hypothetical protein ABSC02_06025 [Acidobacteriota bacterium]|jgi:hypothetical protein